MPDAAAIIRRLGLEPHPEGGHYRETWRDKPAGGGRGTGTAIYYLLTAGQRSHWHRVDATEIWHWYAGSVLDLSLSPDGRKVTLQVLGPDLAADQSPQIVVPAGTWQSAQSRGEWTLVGCTVAPAFEFAGFDLAPAGWAPGTEKDR